MSTVSRVSVPSEFYDITSQIMLRAPEPSYAYARLLMAAAGRAEMLRVGESNAPPSRAIPEQGAAVPDLMDMGLLIGDPIRAEAIVVSDELGRGPGHTVRFNRPRFAGGGYTLASRIIGSSVTISKTAIPITQDQVSLTIQRFAGPFADGGSVVQPYAIDRFDATRSVHSLAGLVGLHLFRDRMKWLDSVIGTLFDDGSTVIYPGDSINATTTDSSAFVAQGDRTMDVETIFRAEQVLNDANVPFFPNGRYMAVLTPTQARQLKSDPAFEQLSTFDQARNPLAASYVGTVGQVEVYQSQTNPTDSSTVAGVRIQHGCVFGPGAVGYAPSIEPARVAADETDNYGETPKFIWLAYEGFGLLNAGFVLNIHSS